MGKGNRVWGIQAGLRGCTEWEGGVGPACKQLDNRSIESKMPSAAKACFVVVFLYSTIHIYVIYFMYKFFCQKF